MKKILSVLFALTLLTTTAYAETVPVELVVEAPIFSVTVPTSLPVNLTSTGEVQVASNATIINGSAGPIKITDIVTNGVYGWETVDYDTFDIKTAKVGSQKVGLSLTIGTNELTTTGTNANSFIGPIVLAKAETLALTYEAKVPAQKDASASTQIAEVIFTVGWDD